MQGPISVIIPALNEGDRIASTIESLDASGLQEIIVVDGGSSDDTVPAAKSLGAKVLSSDANRGRQLNLGAHHATASILLFLHADTSLPPGFADHVRTTLAMPAVSAGAFRFRLNADGWRYRLVEKVVALRCRLLQLPYGDQAIFVSRDMFERAGRFSDLPVMEDFDLVRRLRKLGRIALVETSAVTSARRWQREGLWRLTWRHQLCILGYYLRVSPQRLARWRNPSGTTDMDG